MKTLHKLSLIITLTLISNLAHASEHPLNQAGDIKKYELSIEGHTGVFKPQKSSYLGTQIGAGPNQFDFVTTGDDLRSNAVAVLFKYPVLNNGLKISSRLEIGRAHQDENFATLDPNGSRLLIPGVGVGPAGVGFSLVGPNNQITGAHYNAEFDYYNFEIGMEKTIQTAQPSLKITPSIGLRYNRSITKNKFLGNIPFFIRSFAYDTKMDIKTISPVLGFNIDYAANDNLNLFSAINYSYDLNFGRGRDSLAFSGFDTQSLKMREDDQTHSYGLKIGADYKINDSLNLSLQGNYQKWGNVPVLNVRRSNNPSDFSYEEADSFTGSLRATYKF